MLDDTAIGGPNARFPKTTWGDLATAADPSDPGHRACLDRLVRRYWKPVYAYVRARWRRSVEDSKDMTQAFFTLFIEKGYLGRARPERGSFRSYLKTALQHFLIDALRTAQSRQHVDGALRIDASPDEFARLEPPSPDPDAAYQREWVRALLDAAGVELEERLRADGKAVYHDVFRAYCLEPATILADAPDASPTYGEIAGRLGLKETDVRNYLTYCRTLFSDIVRANVRDTVASDGDVEPELAAVLRLLR